MIKQRFSFWGMLFAALIVWTISAQTQEPEPEHEPDLKWRTLTTPHFSVHFPSGFEERGHKVAALCEEVYEPISRSLNYYPHRTHVVVHTRFDFMHGFVWMFPWRMELFVTEPQNNNANSRDELLRILIAHEFTHIVHLRKHKGFSTITYPFFGEMNAFWLASTPLWFLEGFADFNETRLTRGGAGRSPTHWMQMMAPIKAKKPWQFENTNYHSYKRRPQTEMRYISGYYLSHFVNQRYGPDIWAKILDRYSAFPVVGLSNATKSKTGKSLNQLYQEMLEKFSADTVMKESFAPAVQVWHKPIGPENQYSPRWIDGDHLLIYRDSYDDLPELTEVDRTGKRRQIHQRSLWLGGNSFTVGSKFLVWAELYLHPRFTATFHSDLKLYDRQTGKVRSLTNDARVYRPDLSPDETKVVAVQTALPTSQLVTVTLKNGEVDTLLNIPNSTIVSPRWSADGEWIAFGLRDSTGQQDIAVLEVQSGHWRYPYPPDIFHDNNPCWTPDGRYVLYVSDKSGIFNIWAVEVATGKRWQVTDSELGAFWPDVSPDGRELAFSNYTYTGYTAATMLLDSTRWLDEKAVQPYRYSLEYTTGDTLSLKNGHTFEFPAKTTSYRPWSQIWRPQGWLPRPDEDENGTTLGFWATSRDALHRHAWQTTFALSPDNLRPSVDFSYTYSRWWPEFHLRAYYLPDRVSSQGESGWWRKQGLEVITTVPLVLNINVDVTFLRPFFGVKLQNRNHSTGNIFPAHKKYRGVQFGLVFGRSAEAWRDIVPRRAFNIGVFADHSSSALGSEFKKARQYSSFLNVFLPTPIKHHQVQLLGMYQNRRGEFDYDHFGALPIGYDDDHQPQQLRLRGAYHFPLAYLEWPIPFLAVYFDVLTGSLFYDWGTSWDKGFTPGQWGETDRYSTGLELTFRTFLLRAIPARLGVALYYRSQDSSWQADPVFAIQFGF